MMRKRQPAFILLLACLFAAPPAYCVKSFIEYSKLSGSDTLRDVNALGFYNIFQTLENYAYYAGLEFALFEQSSSINSELATRVVIGINGVNAIAPYAEIGIGLFDFLFRTNDSARTCDENNNCDPDLHFRVGLRFNLTSELAIGYFYEGVSFGGFQDNLTGSHGYTGGSIGIRF